MEELIALGGRTTQLIVAEDMTPCCLLNAGVLIIRSSAWSRALWSELWTAQWAKRYLDTPFYEQSALIRWLQTHCEDICAAVPGGEASFHSYRGGPAVKRTKHLCVVSHEMLNTNQQAVWPAASASDPDGDAPQAGEKAHSEPESPLKPVLQPSHSRSGAQFIFHAVGLPKLHALVGALRAADSRRLLSPMPVRNETFSFRGSRLADESESSWEETLAELRLTNPRYVEKSGVLPAKCALRGDDGELKVSTECVAKELLSRQMRLEHELQHELQCADAASAWARFCTASSRHTWLQILDLSSNCIVRI